MNKNETYLIVGILAVIVVASILYQGQTGQPAPSPSPSGAPTPTPYNPPTYPTPTAPPPSEGPSNAPTSLMITVEPNPVVMENTVYGQVVSDGYNYVITVHGKHVGMDVEDSFNARLDANGQFWHSQTMNTPGYWDFWVTADGVTSNTPRLTVQGALLTMDQTFFSRAIGDLDCSVQLFCHSTGHATVFVIDHDAGISTPIGRPYINIGGYGSMSYDFAGWALGEYEIDFDVNGIKASDYGKSVWITLGR